MRLIDADALINRIVFHTDWSVEEKEAFEDEINVEPTIEPEPKWIPCQERLPENKTAYYIVTLESRGRICVLPNDIDIARWDYDRRKGNDSWHWCKERKVISWMPLPEVYREEGD